MALEEEGEPSPIQTSAVDRSSETVESLISGAESLISSPQSLNSSSSISTRSSARTRSSTNSQASAPKVGASSTKTASSRDQASSPSGSAEAFPLGDSPKPAKAGEGGVTAAGASSTRPTIEQDVGYSKQQQLQEQQRGQEERAEKFEDEATAGRAEKEGEGEDQGGDTAMKEPKEEVKGTGDAAEKEPNEDVKGTIAAEKESKEEVKGTGDTAKEPKEVDGTENAAEKQPKEVQGAGDTANKEPKDVEGTESPAEKEPKEEVKGTGNTAEKEPKEEANVKREKGNKADEGENKETAASGSTVASRGERGARSGQASAPAEMPDLDGALRSPRDPPTVGTVPSEPARNARGVAAPARGTANRNVEEAADGEEEQAPSGGQAKWGGVSEGMFRKRVADELKTMLRRRGGSCQMQEIAKHFKATCKRTLNLQGHKLRVLMTTGTGLYGLGLYGTGMEAVLQLEDGSAVARPDESRTGPDEAFDQSRMRGLTRTIVNQDASRSDDRRRPESAEVGGGARGSSDDRQNHSIFGKGGDRSWSAGDESPLGSRNALGYPSSLADAEGMPSRKRDYSPPAGRVGRGRRHPQDASSQWGGDPRETWRQSRSRSRRRSRSWRRRGSRSRSRSRSLSSNRRGRTALGSNWGGRAGDRVERNVRRSSSTDSRGFSYPARRSVSPYRRHSPQPRRARSPSPRRRGSRRSSPSRKLSGSRSSPRSSSRRRDVSPRRRANLSRYSAEKHSAERARSRRPGDGMEVLPKTRRNGTVRSTAGRDAGSPDMAPSRQAVWKRSAGGAEGEDATMGRGNDARQERLRGQRGDNDGLPPRGHGNVSGGDYGGAPTAGRRVAANGHAAVGEGAAGTETIDPIVPLAPGGASVPPVAAALPGERPTAEGAVGGIGGFSSSYEPPRNRIHAPLGNREYPMGQAQLTGGSWQGANGGGVSQGGGSGPPLAPYPGSAILPPASSLRPLPLPAGRVQGARLMIQGTHPAVPERRIHGIVSHYGVVGKIEVLEGFVFVHMKSIEEASHAVKGLSGKLVPHVSPSASGHSGTPPSHLKAAIWREELYQALMSRENMRIYADSMRRASTWYEKQSKSGIPAMQAKHMACRFYALGRGCVFGKNCGFSHDDHLPQRSSGAGNQTGAARPTFGGPRQKPDTQHMLPSPAFEPGSDARTRVAQLPYRQERGPVLGHNAQSPSSTFVPRNEAHFNPGLGTRRVLETPYTGNDVGVAKPWQPGHGNGAGEASAADRASPHLSTSTGRSVDHQQQARGGGPTKVLESSETRRDGGSRVYGEGSDQNCERGYPHNDHSSGDDSADRSSDGGVSGSRRNDSRDGIQGRSARGIRHGRNRSRGRGDNRHSSSPRRDRGGTQRRGTGRTSSRGAHREREGHDSRSRGSESRENAGDRRSRKHRRDGSVRQQRRDSRSNSPRQYQRGDGSPTIERSALRREQASSRNGRNRDSISPAGQGRRRRDFSLSPRARERRYDNDVGNFDLDGRRKKGRTERDDSRARGIGPRRRHDERERDPFVRRSDGRDRGRDRGDFDLDTRSSKRSRTERNEGWGRGIDHDRRNDSEGEHGPLMRREGGRNGGDNVAHGHGWVSNISGALSRDGDRRSFGVSREGGYASRRNDIHQAGENGARNVPAEWGDDDDLLGQEFMQQDNPPDVDTRFTVMGVHPRPPSPSFSVTLNGGMPEAAGHPRSSPRGRRGGGAARGRGRGRGGGGRFGNDRGGRPPRGFQKNDGEHS